MKSISHKEQSIAPCALRARFFIVRGDLVAHTGFEPVLPP